MIKVKSCNISNAYVQAEVIEKVLTALGPEFDKDARKTAVIVKVIRSSFSKPLCQMHNLWVISPVRLTQIYGLNQK